MRDILKQRCTPAGIEGGFSAHRLRRGFVTEAGRQNVPLGDAMAMSGHASVAVAMPYFCSGSTATSPATHLLAKQQR